MAFPDGWGRKCIITIPAAKIAGNNDNFPILLTEDNLPTEMIDAGVNSAINGGGDIRFSLDSAGATQLPCEIVSFVTSATPGNRFALIWVKYPALYSGADRTLYGWYKKAGEIQPAFTDPYGRNAVWSGYYLASHDCLNDSSGNETFTNSGTVAATGPNGGDARQFDGSDQISNSFDANQRPMTVQVLFNPDAVASEQTLWASEQFLVMAGFGVSSAGDLVSQEWASGANDGTAATATAGVTAAAWHSAAVSYVSDSERTIYLDGGNSHLNTATKGSTAFYSGNSTTLGDGDYGNHLASGNFVGLMAGYRVSKTELSADWIATEYSNWSDPTAFASAGTPEGVGGGGVDVTPGVGAVSITGFAPTAAALASINETPGVASVTLTGYAPTALASASIAPVPNAGNLSLSGYDPDVTVTALIQALPGVGSIAVTGYQPTAVAGANVGAAPLTGSITITGDTPQVTATGNIFNAPGAGALQLTGFAPDVAALSGVSPAPAVGQIDIAGYSPTIAAMAPQEAIPGVAQINLTGYAPIVVSAEPVGVSPAAGQIDLTGFAPLVVAAAPATATPAQAILIMTGYMPALSVTATINTTPGFGSIGITGYAPTVVTFAYSPNLRRTLTVAGNSRTHTITASSRTRILN
tara:strand:+ start:10412 stop:12331 length:1920 start_codon:yes stop_codon:yes gene_type:complete